MRVLWALSCNSYAGTDPFLETGFWQGQLWGLLDETLFIWLCNVSEDCMNDLELNCFQASVQEPAGLGISGKYFLKFGLPNLQAVCCPRARADAIASLSEGSLRKGRKWCAQKWGFAQQILTDIAACANYIGMSTWNVPSVQSGVGTSIVALWQISVCQQSRMRPTEEHILDQVCCQVPMCW